MSVNAAILSNNPVWTANTTAIAWPAAGTWPGAGSPPPPIPILVQTSLAAGGQAGSITISNTGPVNLWIGAAISIALGGGADIYVHDLTSPGVGTYGTVAYE